MKYLPITLGLLLAILIVGKEADLKWFYKWQRVIVTDAIKFCIDNEGVSKLSYDAYHIELYCNNGVRHIDKGDMTTYRFYIPIGGTHE